MVRANLAAMIHTAPVHTAIPLRAARAPSVEPAVPPCFESGFQAFDREVTP